MPASGDGSFPAKAWQGLRRHTRQFPMWPIAASCRSLPRAARAARGLTPPAFPSQRKNCFDPAFSGGLLPWAANSVSQTRAAAWGQALAGNFRPPVSLFQAFFFRDPLAYVEELAAGASLPGGGKGNLFDFRLHPDADLPRKGRLAGQFLRQSQRRIAAHGFTVRAGAAHKLERKAHAPS